MLLQDPITNQIPPEAYAMMVLGAFGFALVLYSNMGGWGENRLTPRMASLAGAIGWILFIAGVSLMVLLMGPAIVDRVGDSWGEIIHAFVIYVPVLLVTSLLVWPIYRELNRRFPNPELDDLKKQYKEQYSNQMDMTRQLIKLVEDIVKKN